MVVVCIKENYSIVLWYSNSNVQSANVCAYINEIESGIWDEIELLTSLREIEWQLCVVKLNEFFLKLN